MLAPIILFAFKRPRETKALLDSLTMNAEAKDSLLYIYCDGAKVDELQESIENIAAVRQIAHAEKRFQQVIVVEQSSNKGLAKSIIDGVSEIINKHDKVIVLEDDLILSPYFLYFMNDSLTRYAADPKVGSIGACNFFACGKSYPKQFFITMPDCWGWATWKDRWAQFEPDPASLHGMLKQKNLVDKFNAYGSYDMESLLLDQVNGNGNSWAVQWTAVSITNDWLSLYPNPSLTHHIESKDATNAWFNITPPLMDSKPELYTVPVIEIPAVVEAMKKGYSGKGDYYGRIKKQNNGLQLFKKLTGSIPTRIRSLYNKNKTQ